MRASRIERGDVTRSNIPARSHSRLVLRRRRHEPRSSCGESRGTSGCRADANGLSGGAPGHGRGAGLDQNELGLTGAYELEIDFREKLRIKQGAVLGAARIVDVVAQAQIIQTIGPGGVLAARQQQAYR